MGISIISKPIFGFLLFFFLLKKQWKILFYIAGVIASGFLISILISNISLYQYWLKKVFLPLLGMGGREVYYNQGLSGFVSRLIQNFKAREFVTALFSIFIAGSAFVLTLKRGNKKLLFSLFISTLLLIDSLSWQHHFVWLIFPFVLLTAYAIRLKNAVLLGLIAVAYLLVSWNFKNPSFFLSFPKILLLSNQFYGAAILWGINVYLLTKAKLTS